LHDNETERTILRFSRKLDTGDHVCDHIILPGPYRVVFARGTSPHFDLENSKVDISWVTFIANSTIDIPSPVNVEVPSGLLRFFVICVFLLGIFLTFGWITMHFLKNIRMFKLLHIIKTSFPASFVLPVDLKTARLIFAATIVVHLVITLPTILMGGISFLFLLTPILGGVSVLLYSPLLGFAYMFLNLASIIAHFSYFISVTFGNCKYSTDNEASMCTSISTAGAVLFLVRVVVLLLFEFIAYSFVYRLLRYKLWLTQQSVLQEPAEFEYHNMSSSSKHF